MKQKKYIYILSLLILISGQIARAAFDDQYVETDKGEVYIFRQTTDSTEYNAYWNNTLEEDTSMHYLNEYVFFFRIRNIRDSKALREQSVSFTEVDSAKLEKKSVSELAELVSGYVPNLMLQQQGSSKNTSFSVRGFGSALGTDPVMGLNIDNVPCLNKSTYDADLFDVANVEVLRGPQGTQSGRNTMLGVTNVYTLSPLDYQGTRVSADYSTANNVKVKASTYHKPKDNLGISVAATYKHSDGFFKNELTDEKSIKSNNANGRFRIAWKPQEKFTIDNVLIGGFLKENGSPYALTDKYDRSHPISIDGDCDYQRFNISDGLVIQYKYEKFIFSSITGYQFLKDKANTDPDYSSQSLVTRYEEQKEHAVSHEFAFKSTTEEGKIWNWKNGLWIFAKKNSIESPYTYHKDGIEQLFLQNLNNHMEENRLVSLQEDQLTISNQFDVPTFGFGLYHQSEFTVKKVDLTAGIRLNYEKTSIDYKNVGELDYIREGMKEYAHIHKYAYGNEAVKNFKALPKISVQYNINKYCNVYGFVASGQRGGGFNTLLFNDLIQNKVLENIGDDLHLNYKEEINDYSKYLSYKGEHSWNFEVGGHVLKAKQDTSVDASISAFYIACSDQQTMVFPNGKSIGSMIVNADKSRSVGVELSVNLKYGNFAMDATYGYTNAKFKSFTHDGIDYSGKYIPFAPSNTAAFNFQYAAPFHVRLLDRMIFGMGWRGYGKIFWDLDNQYSQRFYGLFDLNITWQYRKFELSGWAKNLANKDYDTYVVSALDNYYRQRGNPRQIGVTISYKFE